MNNNLSISNEILLEFGFIKKNYSANIENSYYIDIRGRRCWACLVKASPNSEAKILECYWGINSEPIYCNDVGELRRMIDVLSICVQRGIKK